MELDALRPVYPVQSKGLQVIGERYRVHAGDNLWTISRHKLGAGNQWPRIWRYNNRRDIVAVTGRGIVDPDLIYPGQLLLLPILPGATKSSAAAPRATGDGRGQPLRSAGSDDGGSLSQQLPHITSPISFKYKLEDLKFPPIVQPGVVMEMRMTGDIVLMSKKAVPALYVTNRREVELQMTSQANHAFGALVADTRLVYDAVGNKLTYRSMLVSQSNSPGVPTTAIGIEMNSSSPVPKLRYEIRLPKLDGSLPDFFYAAVGVTIVVELTPTPLPPSGPSAQPVRVPATNWHRVIGTGLIVTGAAIVVGTLVEDFFSAGAGVVDDPASFAAAAAAFARASTLMRGAAVVLPRAAIPAAAALTITVTAPRPAASTSHPAH